MKKKPRHISSSCVKQIHEVPTQESHVLPLYATSSFEFSGIEESIEIFTQKKDGFVYSRYRNPTVEQVAHTICRMEMYDLDEDGFGLMTSSGMSAIHTLISSILESGDSVLTQWDLYGGTTELFKKVLIRSGIKTIFGDLNDTTWVEEKLKSDSSIKLVYFETPANPTMQCIDIAQLCRISAAQGVLTCVDNTFCTPILQRPLSLGADFVIHSTTKYLNGHGNSIAGAIIGKDEKWKQQVWTSLKLSGAICSPWEAWLVYNGIKTLHLRMERHSSNGLALARWLQSHPQVRHVNYCGLEDNVSFPIASKQMSDFGGMLSFAVECDMNGTLKFIDALQFCTHAPTLGDVDTLVLHPATSSHLNVDRGVRISQGITDNLIRVSVGIENIEDIIEDFSQAFKNID